ncbi:unnamed protein product [Strongylus vulgaris]|uniref:Uncharacterized protein n=1 Tax=Strongylus vulgaris TaxID=40348 RepID=A0A3P7JIL9_STRVU|nr:unnamed protein product [Strongylus vulgaris]
MLLPADELVRLHSLVGIGKRPNQHYLPSGCRAMLRLNYSFSEQLLKITTLHDEHLNHEVSPEMFRKVSAKLKRSSCGGIGKRPNQHYLPSGCRAMLRLNYSFSEQMSLTQPNAMANVAIALQQQQIMASLLSQQKENINLAAGLSSIGIPRPQPSMLNILSMMGLQQRMLLQQQPAYGLVAPLTQQIATPPQAQSVTTLEEKPNANDLDRQVDQILLDLCSFLKAKG